MERGTDPKGSQPRINRAVVVLGARVQPDGSPSPALLRRVRAAVALVSTDPVPGTVMVLSGGYGKKCGPPLATEAEVMAAAARHCGVSAKIPLWLENRSRNTLENARASTDLLAPRRPGQVVVVTDRAHLSRALMCFRAARKLHSGRWTITGHAVLVPDRAEAMRACGREAVARGLYRLRLLRGAMLAAVPPAAHDADAHRPPPDG